MIKYDTIEADVLVVGGGAAGARAAIEADAHGVTVALVSKGPVSKSGTTPQAWPSYEAAFGFEDSQDSPDVHFQDTVREGRYLGDENLIRVLVDEAIDRVSDLERYGVRFRKKGDRFLQVLHPGQSYPRCLVIQGGGYALISRLRRELRRHSSIRVFEDCIVTRILTYDGRAVGAVALDLRAGTCVVFRAKAVILATGGYTQLWQRTDTAPGVTGDGIALGYEAGAGLVDMEMVLYYPTVIVHPPALEGILVQYEGLLGPQYIGGKLLNARGEEFLPPGKLPVRDVLIQLIGREIAEGRGTEHDGVYIDITKSTKNLEEINEFLKRLDSLPYNNLADLGFDIRHNPIEVAPAVHYTLGGIHINERGETTAPGLYAAGEVTGNIHGANRLSGNALAETQVFGARAGRFSAEEAKAISRLPPFEEGAVRQEIDRLWSLRQQQQDGIRPLQLCRKLKGMMSRYVDLTRHEAGLKKALAEIGRMRGEDLPRIHVVDVQRFNLEWLAAIEVAQMLGVGEIVAHAALLRTESRGHHFRSDYRETKDEWLVHTVIRKGEDGMVCSTAPVIRLN